MQDYNPVELVRAAADGDDGFGGGNGWWIILLFMFLGWGNNGFGNGGSNDVYPMMENQQNLFTGFGNMQTALTAGFANAETAATARQMSDMNQMFSLSQQLSQCCCENRLATANLQAALASEACADRAAVNDAARDIIANQNAGIQMIMDKLCNQDLEAARRENEQLRQQLAMANLAASQVSQTAQIIDALKTTTAAG